MYLSSNFNQQLMANLVSSMLPLNPHYFEVNSVYQIISSVTISLYMLNRKEYTFLKSETVTLFLNKAVSLTHQKN